MTYFVWNFSYTTQRARLEMAFESTYTIKSSTCFGRSYITVLRVLRRINMYGNFVGFEDSQTPIDITCHNEY